MKSKLRTLLNLAVLAINLIGIVAYLYHASFAWAIPEERAAGIYAVSGEPFVWFAAVVPLFCAFFVLDVLWAIPLFYRTKPTTEPRIVGLILIVAWLIAILVDFAHH